jgi:hypothetical protein
MGCRPQVHVAAGSNRTARSARDWSFTVLHLGPSVPTWCSTPTESPPHNVNALGGHLRPEYMMRNVFLYMTTTLDGFVAGPNNELDWMIPTPEPELTGDIIALLSRADSGFVGYPVATEMVPYWRAAAKDPKNSEGSRALAEAVNRLRTVVISKTREDFSWDNSELLVVDNDADLVDGNQVQAATRNGPRRAGRYSYRTEVRSARPHRRVRVHGAPSRAWPRKASIHRPDDPGPGQHQGVQVRGCAGPLSPTPLMSVDRGRHHRRCPGGRTRSRGCSWRRPASGRWPPRGSRRPLWSWRRATERRRTLQIGHPAYRRNCRWTRRSGSGTGAASERIVVSTRGASVSPVELGHVVVLSVKLS